MGTILTSFSYALADGVRWVPNAVRQLLLQEIEARNDEAKKTLHGLVKKGSDAYIDNNKETLHRDSQRTYKQLYPGENLPEDNFKKILDEVKRRLDISLKGDIMPSLTFTRASFSTPHDDKMESEWGTAFSLLLGIVRYPYEAASIGNYFERNFKKVNAKSVLEAMNILKIQIFDDSMFFEDWQSAKAELEQFDDIIDAEVPIKQKCSALLVLAKTGVWKKCFDELKKSENINYHCCPNV